ncbi:MAG: hypothetical protein IT447_15280 [Phycisphaerales bacterium]|jgi:hypothetical protein|nr:hypothetical protein [Phycisphaerales bacterium]
MALQVSGAFAAVVCTAVYAQAGMVSVIGGTLRVVEGGTAVQAKFIGANSLFTNELYLDSPTFQGPIFISTSSAVNATASMGTFLPETVLFIRDQSYLPSQNGGPASFNFGWFTGTGELPLNPDHLPHAVFTWDTDEPAGPVIVGFEDMFGGGDLDFNDAVYSFTNVKVGVVTVALTPINIPSGDSIYNDNTETRTLSGLNGSLSNSGLITNDGSLINYGNFDSDGEIQNLQNMFNDVSAHFNNSGTLDNFGTIRSFGTLETVGLLTNGGTTLNNGTINNTGHWVSEIAASLVNGGQGKIENQSTMTNHGELLNNGKLTNTGLLDSDGIFTNEGTGQVINGGFGIMKLTDKLFNKGTFENVLGAWVEIKGVFQNTNSVQNNGDITNKNFLDNSGLLQNGGMLVNETGAVLGNTGTILNSGTVENAGQISNTGELVIEAGASINGDGTYVQDDMDATTTINGQLKQSVVQISSGIIKGAGKIEAFLDTDYDATLAPGNSPGTMTIDGSLHMLGSTLEIELDSPGMHDLLLVTGDVEIDGVLIKYLFNYTPAPGDSFAFLTADGNITGLGTATFQMYGNLSGLSFNTQLIGDSIVLTVVPEPTTTGLLAVGLILNVLRSRSSHGRHRMV